jgi:hypothetical protein
MLAYHPEVFQSLYDFPDARRQLFVHQAKIQELGSVVRQNHMEEVVGVSLLHKHFALSPNERLVEGYLGDKRCCRPKDVANCLGVLPYMWKVTPNYGAEWRYHPLEFFPSTDERLNFSDLTNRVLSNDVFLTEMASKLMELELTDMFGISILHRTSIPLSQNEILVETTNEASRTLLFSAMVRDNIPPQTVLTKTLWRFDCDVHREQACGHCVHCSSHCAHCTGC